VSSEETFPLNSRILIADDSTSSRDILMTELKKLGYQNLMQATNGDEARGLLERANVDLLMSDVHMPSMTGIALLRWLRQESQKKDLPVIILTSSTERSEILEAARLNVNHYLLKPIMPKVLKQKLQVVWMKFKEQKSGV